MAANLLVFETLLVGRNLFDLYVQGSIKDIVLLGGVVPVVPVSVANRIGISVINSGSRPVRVLVVFILQDRNRIGTV